MSSGVGRHPLVERAGYHAARAWAWARRATVPGMSVRVVIWLSGAAALVLASPLRPAAVAPVAAVLALLPAGFPHTAWVSLVELLAIGGIAASVTAGQPPLWIVLLVAGLLYLHHTTAALGAQLRTDTVVPPSVLRYWARRTGLALASSLPLALGVVAFGGQAPAGPATGYLALGAAAAVAVTAGLAAASSRRL